MPPAPETKGQPTRCAMTRRSDYANETLDQIRAAVPLRAVLPEGAPPKACPLCGDDDEWCHLDEARGCWTCACGCVGGDVISLCAAIEGVGYLLAVQRLAQRVETLNSLRNAAGGEEA